MTNEEMIAQVRKAVTATGDGSGLAAPQDAEEFVDLAVEQTAILSQIHVVTGIRTTYNLDAISLAEPVLVAGTEGSAPADDDVVSPSRVRRVLQPKECVAAFDVSYSFLRQNIEGERVNESLNRLFAKRFGKDVVMAAFMGDTTLAGTSRTNKTLRVVDGFVKRALSDASVHEYVIPASPSYSTVVFPGMLSQLPKDYRDEREDLGLFVSADVYDAYAAEIGSRATALGDMILAGAWGKALSYMGITLYPVFGLASDRVVLTLRQNLAVGFGREMTPGVDFDNRARLMKVTITADVDASYVQGDALVLGVGEM